MRRSKLFLRAIAGLPRLCEKCCRRESDGAVLQIDRRIPKRVDASVGTYHRDNVHLLCLRCHHEKSRLDTAIAAVGPEAAQAWSDYAYPVEAQSLEAVGVLFQSERFRALNYFAVWATGAPYWPTFEAYESERRQLAAHAVAIPGEAA